MLSNEGCAFGWTRVIIHKTEIAHASYLDNVPMDILDAFIQYFTDILEKRPSNFLLSFNQEGSLVYLVYLPGSGLVMMANAISDEIYQSITHYVCKNLPNPDNCSDRMFLKQLAKEAITDIRRDIDIYQDWDDEPDAQRRRLLSKCDKLEHILPLVPNR